NIQVAPDADEGDIHIHFPGTDGSDDSAMGCPGRPGFLLPLDEDGRVLVGVGKELRVADLQEGLWTEPLATIPDADPRTIINDGEIVPGGKAVVFGTKDVQFKDPIAHLYLYTVDDERITVL